MTIDRAELTWAAKPYPDTDPARSTARRGTWSAHAVAVLRATALIVIAALAILVLLPAAIAAQAAFAA